MTRSQVSFPCNSIGFAGFKVIPIQFNEMQFYKQLSKLCKTQAEYSGRGIWGGCWNPSRLRGQEIPFPLVVWRGRGSEKWVGQSMGKYINLDGISLLHRVGALPEFWGQALLSTTNGSERLRRKWASAKPQKCVGQRREREEAVRVWEGFSPSPKISRLPRGRGRQVEIKTLLPD